MHSRPLYGGLLSQYIKRNGDIQKHDSRPLYGGLLSQWKYDFESIRKLQFSSPLRGSLISINTNAINKIFGYTFSSPLRGSLISIPHAPPLVRVPVNILVPSTGVSYLNPVPYTSQNTRLLSPICGANPQMREISISNWCITFSKPDFKPIGAKSLYFLKFNPPPSPYDTAFPDTLYIYRHAVPV